MAEATKTTRTVTTTEERYTLDLSAQEFSYLKGVIGDLPTGDGDGASRRIWNAMQSPANGDMFEHQGVTYDLKAEYLDASGDRWKFTGARDTSGQPLISCLVEDTSEYQDWSLSRFVETYSYGSGIRRR
ncbi:phiSA1p31-related protein [Streptomyces cylindrosporus]|uniref:PhiSA1p31-related protein n=1 Tax=Streptomyces cylindrosporus TaxID=2927583 RepID=A0ABS9Y1G2_9ACTN|nr:phiSA1p31-related protein [Streptomyces cylindrosporus]MCI3271044.1 phiSA1p31-related protein [Streptomyces cylindrosporus]